MKININIRFFWFTHITEEDLDGDFENTEHYFGDYLSCWCKPITLYTDPITGNRLVLHRKLEH